MLKFWHKELVIIIIPFFVYRRVKWGPTNYKAAFEFLKQVINSSDFFSKALNLAKP